MQKTHDLWRGQGLAKRRTGAEEAQDTIRELGVQEPIGEVRCHAEVPARDASPDLVLCDSLRAMGMELALGLGLGLGLGPGLGLRLDVCNPRMPLVATINSASQHVHHGFRRWI